LKKITNPGWIGRAERKENTIKDPETMTAEVY
jgi:hypothetical protein